MIEPRAGDSQIAALPARGVRQIATLRLRSMRTSRHGDLGVALLYCAPALVVFALFTYRPFIHAILLSLFRTNPQGEPVTWYGLGHFLRVLGLDGSGRTEYLSSIATSFLFALLVVPAGLVTSLALGLLALSKVRFIGVFRTIFTISIAISLASAGTIWSLIFNPSTGTMTWLVNLLQLKPASLLENDATSLIAVAVMTIWSGLGFNFIVTLARAASDPEGAV